MRMIVKDPGSAEPRGFDWTPYLEELGPGVGIQSSVWDVATGDGALTLGDDSILTGSRKTQVILMDGTVGRRYTVTNRIQTNSDPPFIDERSFRVLVQDR